MVEETVQAAPTAAAPLVPAERKSPPWLWIFSAALIGLGVAAALLRRMRAAPAKDDALDFVVADSGAPLPVALDEGPPPPPAPTPPAPKPIAPPVIVPRESDPVSVELEPLRFSVSLMNATLQYRLRLTNLSTQGIGPIAVAADMIGAHASLSDDSQLGRDGAGLEVRHELATLAPGESAEMKGEFRLPLASVTPIKSGIATLIVPLVRLRVDGPGISLTRAVVVGESPTVPGGLLRPFRLDTGPKIFGAVSQRGIAEAA